MAQKEQNSHADIVLSCLEEEHLKREIVLKHHSLIRVISGQMHVTQADDSYTFVAGDTLLLPRNQLSMITKTSLGGKPFRSVMMTFTTERLKELYAADGFKSIKPHTHKIRSFPKHPLLDSVFASLEPYFQLSSKLPANIVSLKLGETIAVLRALDSDIDTLLSDFSDPGKLDLVEFMEKHFMINMSMDKFGHLTGRSLNTFKRDFQKAFNTTPQKWLTQKRLELAHYHLAQSQRKPADIYLEVGFENLSHFSFAFKKYYGYPPTAVLRQKSLQATAESH
ncbi:helix-turn-helix domain-containing protein [Spirosoma rhododendri]|uniref:Helix-turn-helix transcriptional regulator n=1 Tax=Spirosoma rhododendri TaxID=2728024 RepID=A0A7L5DSV2_9BACT|nr:AraC family transcriptional regulator [Spirosoma rhododendri]QJD80353.1 helix-turn-helix transcriptional regulator [Spirosoma rhododendri]